jgi:hypothetical protein
VAAAAEADEWEEDAPAGELASGSGLRRG